MTTCDTVFSKLEIDCKLEAENNKLREQIKSLTTKLEILEQNELERTKFNPNNIQAVVVYRHSGGAFLICDESQKLQFSNCADGGGNSSWGPGLTFNSLANMYTQLYRLGFKFSHSQEYYYSSQGTQLNGELWVKGC